MIALSDTLNYYGAYSKAPTLTRPLISPFQHPAHFQIIILKSLLHSDAFFFIIFKREVERFGPGRWGRKERTSKL